jgi:hypothetical protein
VSTQTIRQSTILIASGKRTSVYSSLDQVPAGLKRKLMHSTSGSNSATILLADRAGREEIVRALRGMPSHVQARLAAPKVPWTEAFARKQTASSSPGSPSAFESPSVMIERPRRAIDAWYELKDFVRGVEPGAWPRLILKWSRGHWPELLLPVGVAIGLWALLVS